MSWFDSTLIEQLGWSLLHFLWQGALIGLVYAATLPATRNATARTRYGIAVITLAALAAAPALTLVVLMQATGAAAPAATGAAATLSYLQVTVNAGAGEISVMQVVVAAWLAGVAVLSARLLLGWHFLRRLRRSADFAAAAPLRPHLEALVSRLDIRRPVALAVSKSIRSPVVIGWLKPLVLLPPAIVTGLPARQLEMVLAHELAHVRRLDHLVNLGQVVIETALFYHPVVRWVSRRIRIERENACDDLAVAVTQDRLAYVEMLASLEKLRYRGPRLALAMHDGQLLGRIRRLVERGRPGRQQGLTGPALLSALILAAAGSLHLLEDDPPPSEPEPVVAQQPETLTDEMGPDGADDRSPSGLVTEPNPIVALPTPREDQPVEASAAPASESGQAFTVGSRSASTEEAREAGSEPPGLPSMQTERLPPVAELIERPSDRRLAMVETPSLALANLPRPTRQRSPEPESDILLGGELVERIEPAYPKVARQKGLNGNVEVEFLVTREGGVRDVEILDETPRGLAFAEAAREAIVEWRFEPFRKGDEPVERRVQLEVSFDLGDADHRECRSVLGSRIPRCY